MSSALGFTNVVSFQEKDNPLWKECDAWQKEAYKHLRSLQTYERASPIDRCFGRMYDHCWEAADAIERWKQVATRLGAKDELRNCEKCWKDLLYFEDVIEARRSIDKLTALARKLIDGLNKHSKKADLEYPFLRTEIETREIDNASPLDESKHCAYLRDQVVNHDVHAETKRLAKEENAAKKNPGPDDADVQREFAPLFDIPPALSYNGFHNVVDSPSSTGVLGTGEEANGKKS